MPRKRQSNRMWDKTRKRIWLRDGGICQYPYGKHPVSLSEAHIDHIQSGRIGKNDDVNLRVLCRYHHVLRVDNRHRGMIANAIRDAVIPPDWRNLAWDE